jgi:predicted NBD/HSP70 family sugar kinase
VDAVLREATAGSPAALGALDSVGRWLGFGLSGLVNVFNPRLVVLGGVFARIHPFVARTLDEELGRHALPAPRRLVRVVPAALGVDAPLLGAAELAFEPLLADPAVWLGPRDGLAELASA